MRVFIDVGAHQGQSVLEALQPRHGFETIHTVEPSRACIDRLKQFRDGRIHVHHCALGKTTGTLVLHGAGHKGASLYADKSTDTAFGDETVGVVDAAEWVRRHLKAADENYLKLNCEGAEADILERLAETRLVEWFKGILLSMDIQKIPSQQERTAAVLALVERFPSIRLREPYVARSERGSLTLWFDEVVPPVTPRFGDRVRFALGLHLPHDRMILAWKQRLRRRLGS